MRKYNGDSAEKLEFVIRNLFSASATQAHLIALIILIMNIPTDLKAEILQTLDKSDLGLESLHAENTLHWVKTLESNPSLALQIAALGHDIERGVPPRYKSEDFKNYGKYKQAHSDRGAKLLEEIMLKHKVDEDVIVQAKKLVELHEVGGTEEADILMDADSISFFDNNLEFYISYKGLEGALRHIDYKFQRCSSRARKYIEKIETYKSFKKKV